MSSSSTRRTRHATPSPSPLVQRLKRLNNNGLAEKGEEGYPGLITLQGFKDLVKEADLKSIRLPYFSPFRMAKYSFGEKEIQFYDTSLKWAVLSHLGLDKSNPEWEDHRWDPQIFYFRGSDLRGASLDNARCSFVFIDCTMTGINMSGLKIFHQAGISISECEAARSNFSNSDIHDINWAASDFKNANFKNTTLEKIVIEDSILDGADFSKAVLKNQAGEEMHNCTFIKTKFVSTKFKQIKFQSCNLDGANFAKAEFQYHEFVNCTFVGTKFQKAVFMNDCTFENCNLAGAHFGNANLSKVRFLNCTNFPTTPQTKWTDRDYKKCDNEQWKEDEDEEEDPDDEEDRLVIDPHFVYKRDPISLTRLRRGKEMVMIRKKNTNGPLQPDCYNRKTIQEWYDTTRRNGEPFTNPKNRDEITADFFIENGGFLPPMRQDGGTQRRKDAVKRRSRRIKIIG